MSTEAAVISAVCKNKDMGTLLQLNADDMFISHRDIWDSLKAYYSKYRSVPDISILEDRFTDFMAVPTTETTSYYIDRMRDEFLQSKLRDMLVRTGTSLKSDSPSRIIEQMQVEVNKLGKYAHNVRDVDVIDLADAESYYEALRQQSIDRGGTPGIPTGIKAIDICYPTGMAGGHLIVIIGWPGRGKSFISAYIACKAWEQGYRPMIVSLEMSPEDMRNRIYTLMGSGLFNMTDFQRGMINMDDFHSWGKRSLENKQSFIITSNDGVSDITPAMVQGKIEQYRPDLVICDYHQLFNDNKNSRSEVERNKNISREFKQLAMSNNIPIIDITAATMDDISDQDNPPMLSQVAWSKAIEYDADLAFAVHRHTDTDIIELVGRKSRHGTLFAVFLNTDLGRGVITETFESS